MRYVSSLSGAQAGLKRRFKIGVTVIDGQVVRYLSTGTGQIDNPASVTSYANTAGVTQQAGTYTTTQGTGSSSADVLAETVYNPDAMFLASISGGTVRNTAFAAALDGNLLTNATADTTGLTIADTNVGTSDYSVHGFIVGLLGANGGASRTIRTHTDNTSEAVTVPFDYTIAVNDTFLRLPYNFLNTGMELTTVYDQYRGRVAAAGTLPRTGESTCVNIYVTVDSPFSVTNPGAFAWVRFNRHAYAAYR